MKRVINGFEVDWASERVFAEQQTAPNYGYLFEVSGDLLTPSPPAAEETTALALAA